MAEFLPKLLRGRNVTPLPALITTGNQHDSRFLSQGVIDSRPRSLCDAQFPNAAAHWLAVAEVARAQARHACCNGGLQAHVPQTVKPLVERPAPIRERELLDFPFLQQANATSRPAVAVVNSRNATRVSSS